MRKYLPETSRLFVSAILSFTLLFPLSPALQAQIVVDGDVKDWAAIAPLIRDPVDGLPFPNAGGWDIVSVSATTDDSSVFLLIEFTETSIAAAPSDGFIVDLDTDLDPQTGCPIQYGDIFGSSGVIGSEVLIGANPSNPSFNTLSDFRSCISIPSGQQPLVAAAGRFVEVSIPKGYLASISPGTTGFDIVVRSGSDATNKVRYSFGEARVPRPPYPVVFVHGLCSTPGTWNETTAKLVGWTDGGTLTGFATSAQLANQPFDADFYRVDFDDLAIEGGLAEWGSKVSRFLDAINEHRAAGGPWRTKFIVVAHSAGGLAARAYMQLPSNNYANDVFHLITYGTPHSGTPLASLGLSTCNGTSGSQGVAELTFVSVPPLEIQSDFLKDLNARPLPSNTIYTSLIGWGCVFSDCVVATRSQDLSQAIASLAPSSHAWIRSWKHHGAETSDYSHILEAINRKGLFGVDSVRIRVGSPIDLIVTTPDGQQLSKSKPEAGLNVYEEIQEPNGDRHDTVTIPLAMPGIYTIQVTAEPDSLPDDMYSLFVDRNGTTTTLAANVSVRDIPSAPYVFESTPPITIPVKVAPGDALPTLNMRSRGTTPIAILSTPSFDAVASIDASSLTFGRTGFEHTLHRCNSGEDVNKDGLLDLMCHFRAADTNLRVDSPTAFLRGETTNGTLIVGSDAVRVLP